MDENIFKVISGAIVSFMTYCIYMVKQHTKREDKQDSNIHDLQVKASVTEEQMKHVLNKMDDILSMGERLSRDNLAIIKTLARHAKKD